MLEQDRVFLRDFISLTFKNHMMAVEALFRAGQQGREFAALTLRRANPSLSEEAARAEEVETNEGARFQAVMFAKVLAEYVAALEDFGALCLAIRKRFGRGILREYFAAETGAVADFFDGVLKLPDEDMSATLSLPELKALEQGASQEELEFLQEHSRGGAQAIRALAQIYREPPLGGGSPGLTPLRPDWASCVHVLLGVAGDGKKPPRGVFPWTFNKLKHRFAVLESVEEYAALSIAAECEVVAVDKSDERIALLVDATRMACMAAAEIAATVMHLDERGVLGP